KNEGYGAEVRWNVDDLVAAGQMIMGHTYRLQLMVHDGDQNQTGGDAGENCVNVHPNCTDAASCDDRNPCTAESCDAGDCHNAPIAGCKPCTTAADCDDQNACTTESCDAGVCANGTIPGCTPCTTTADCDDQDACTQDLCTAGACQHTPLENCPAPLVEICGDCIDNDGNGLTDFEDPACCSGQVQRFTMDLKRGRIRPRGVTS